MKGMINQHAAGSRNESLALKRRTEPVTDFHFSVAPVQIAKIDLSCQSIFIPDADRKTFIVRKTCKILRDPLLCPFDRTLSLSQPPRPFSDMLEIPGHQRVQFCRMARFNQTKLGIVVNFITQHSGLCPS